MPGLPPPRHIPTLPSNLATSAHSGLTTIEAVRGRVVPAVHIARDGIGLADRAIETRESGAIRRNRIRPGPWRLHRRAWFGLSPVRGNRLDRRFCSANVIMEPRWRPAKQRCPDPATAPSVDLGWRP
jgi:hypothetical protein